MTDLSFKNDGRFPEVNAMGARVKAYLDLGLSSR